MRETLFSFRRRGRRQYGKSRHILSPFHVIREFLGVAEALK